MGNFKKKYFKYLSFPLLAIIYLSVFVLKSGILFLLSIFLGYLYVNHSIKNRELNPEGNARLDKVFEGLELHIYPTVIPLLYISAAIMPLLGLLLVYGGDGWEAFFAFCIVGVIIFSITKWIQKRISGEYGSNESAITAFSLSLGGFILGLFFPIGLLIALIGFVNSIREYRKTKSKWALAGIIIGVIAIVVISFVIGIIYWFRNYGIAV
jgi:hypothetical protein